MMWTGWQLTRMGHSGAREALEGRRRRVNAERNPIAVDLVLNEPMQLVFDLGHAGQLALPEVIERPLGHGLEVTRVPPRPGGAVGAGVGATGAHAGMVP